MKVALVFGGKSNEHSISLLSARSIKDALEQAQHQVLLIGITPRGTWTKLAAIPQRTGDVLPALSEVDSEDFGKSFGECVNLLREADVVFPALHGPFGEDGTIQGLFDLLDVAYVGSGVLASATCMDKPTAKARLMAAGLPTPRYAAIDLAGDTREHSQAVHQTIEEAQLEYPIFVKPARGGSSLGMSKVLSEKQLAPAVTKAANEDVRIIFEEAIENMQEIECGVLVRPGAAEPVASTPSEIKVKPPHDFYSFEAKYLDDSADLVVPADLSPALTLRIQELALEVFAVMGCDSLARVDFFVSGDRIMVNEINTMPGFTEISMYPRMFVETGVSYQELVDDLVVEAKSRFER